MAYKDPEHCKTAAYKAHRAALNRAWQAAHPGYYRTKARKAYHAAWLAKRLITHPGVDAENKRRHALTRACNRYGLLVEEYHALAEHGCGICGAMPKGIGAQHRLSIDHDHQTEEFKGLLCHTCNVGLGFFDKHKDRLLKVLKYLKPQIDHVE